MSAASDAALGQLYGPPALGTSGSVAVDGTDKTVNLIAGVAVMITVNGGSVYLAFGGAATTPANQTLVLDQGTMLVACPGAWPGDGKLHLTQGPAAGATVYYSMVP